MENDLKVGYIYKICNKNSDKIYIGSTVKSLQERFSQHLRVYKYYLNSNNKYLTSIEIVKDETSYIEQLAEVQFYDKKELLNKESLFIDMYKDICVNKNIVFNVTDRKQYIKKYYEKNKEKIKKYYENNKSKILETKKKNYEKNYKEKYQKVCKEYYKKNKEKIKEYNEKNKEKYQKKSKEYYEKNKEKILKKVNCEYCNKIVTNSYLKIHQSKQICLKNRLKKEKEMIDKPKTIRIKIKKIV